MASVPPPSAPRCARWADRGRPTSPAPIASPKTLRPRRHARCREQATKRRLATPKARASVRAAWALSYTRPRRPGSQAWLPTRILRQTVGRRPHLYYPASDVKQKATRKKLRIGRLALGFAASCVFLVLLVWYSVHHFDWAGPLVANSLRSAFGDDKVAALEDFVYGLEDRVNRLLKKNEPPKAYWHVPDATAASAVATSAAAPLGSAPATSAPATAGTFRPANPGPALKEWSAPGDGEWLGVVDVRHPDEPPRMFKTLLHPDKGRSWAEVF